MGELMSLHSANPAQIGHIGIIQTIHIVIYDSPSFQFQKCYMSICFPPQNSHEQKCFNRFIRKIQFKIIICESHTVPFT